MPRQPPGAQNPPESADQITALMSAGAFNFDVPPPGSLIGPLKSLIQVAGECLDDARTWIYSTEGELSVQTARGVYLDAHGWLYGLPRLPNETPPDGDGPYRQRLLSSITAGRSTLDGLQTLLQAYYGGAGANVIVRVFDLQSDPVACASITYTDPLTGDPTTPQEGDVIVQVSPKIPSNRIWFASRSHISFETFAYPASLRVLSGLADPQAQRVIERNKAGGSWPVYVTKAVIVPPV